MQFSPLPFYLVTLRPINAALQNTEEQGQEECSLSYLMFYGWLRKYCNLIMSPVAILRLQPYVRESCSKFAYCQKDKISSVQRFD